MLILVRHEPKGVGVDLGYLVFGRFIGRSGLSGVVLQLVGLARFQRGIGGAAAGEDGGVGAHIDFHAGKGLHSPSDDIGAIAGAVVDSIGVVQRFADLPVLGLQGSCRALMEASLNLTTTPGTPWRC